MVFRTLFPPQFCTKAFFRESAGTSPGDEMALHQNTTMRIPFFGLLLIHFTHCTLYRIDGTALIFFEKNICVGGWAAVEG